MSFIFGLFCLDHFCIYLGIVPHDLQMRSMQLLWYLNVQIKCHYALQIIQVTIGMVSRHLTYSHFLKSISSDYMTWCHFTYSQCFKKYRSNATKYYRSSANKTLCHLAYSHIFKKYRSNATMYYRSSDHRMDHQVLLVPDGHLIYRPQFK